MSWNQFGTIFTLCGLWFAAVPSDGAISIKKGPYHGWSEAVIIGNGKVEAVIVPQVGRVMQFRFVGEEDGPFWENRLLDGKRPDSHASEWGNFGGDKSWPAPQADWEKITGRGWPPPAAFDSMPVSAEIEGDVVILRAALDPHYGIQEERRVALKPNLAEMEIETIYHKKQGRAVRVGIWTITQLKDAELVFMPVPLVSLFPAGYNKQSDILPLDLKKENGWVTCRRSPKSSTKIGSDASQLIWVGKDQICEVFARRESVGEFPDNGSSAEIYTNADPLAYIELELLGPLKTLSPGEKMSRSQSYRLFKREKGSMHEQVKSLIR